MISKALCHASSKGHLRCVQKLLKLNADPTIFTIDYFYPFDLAEKSGNKNVKLVYKIINLKSDLIGSILKVSSLIKRFMRVKKFENKDEFEKIFNEEDTEQLDNNKYF